jgi:thiamine pyrophosphate-dependent acetolactate synthase large subunit-like protein
MNTAELKSDLHKFVVETDDINILTQMREYFKSLIKTKTDDWWNTLTTEQQNSINKGIEQLNNNKGITHENVRRNVNKLLGKDE